MLRKSAKASKRKAAKATKSRNVPRHLHSRAPSEVLDACDLKLSEAEATPDEDLPAAEGGVA